MKKAIILAKNDTFWIPNTKQKKLAQLLADPTDERTNQAKSEEVGVSLRTFYRYIKDPNFVEYVNSLVPQETDKKTAPIWRSLCREAEKGNIQAIKLFFEAKGICIATKEANLLQFNQYNQLTDEQLIRTKKELEQKIIELSKKEDIQKQLEDQSQREMQG